MLSKILVPVDGSDNSFRALEHALFIAKSIGAQVTAMHVIEHPPTVYVESQKLLNDLMSNYRKESAKILDECKEVAKKSGVNLETVIAEGDAASNITGYAEQGGFDLVVIGSRGLGRLKEMMLGSTSNKVLHNTKCSVMVVK
ncbi:MAG TPA: universal stress protein [Nitrososphaera sp.]|nr:universal stress protein [Nitrososphaera sp.]